MTSVPSSAAGTGQLKHPVFHFRLRGREVAHVEATAGRLLPPVNVWPPARRNGQTKKLTRPSGIVKPGLIPMGISLTRLRLTKSI